MLPMNGIRERLGLDITFNTLQNMLFGNPTFLGGAENLTLAAIDSGLHVKNQLDALQIDFQLNKNCQILNTEIKRADDPTKVLVTYTKYLPFNDNFQNRFFSFTRQLQVQGTGRNDGTILFEFESPLEINIPKKMRFEIPKDYKKIDKL
jgi:hypothetical protein